MRTSIAVVALMFASGCASTQGVRYVYQDGEYGVVGLPENTDRWPTRYRTRAEQLMDEHFPGGHEIVRAEEVVEGSRTLTIQGTKTAELSPQLPTELLQVAKLGRTASRSQADTLKIKEARIIYRRALRPTPEQAEAFAESASVTPAEYIDPNAPERHKAVHACEAETTATATAKADAKAPEKKAE